MLPAGKAVPPAVDDVRRLRDQLQGWLVPTPLVRCRNLESRLDTGAEIHGKMEFLQRTGTFKARGALAAVLGADAATLGPGVTAVSAGNHAIAASFAARAKGVSAKVVMISSASPARVDACRALGAEVVLADNVHEAFELVESIRNAEGRFFLHPFEGPAVAAGTATLGLEICETLSQFDAIVIPIGGGGLCAGISSVVRQLNPDCRIIGVEPAGAGSMHASFKAGRAEKIEMVNTIADSLGAPFALPYSYSLCHQFVDELVSISDDEMRAAMRMLFLDMKIAVEPACAASTAALAGPLLGRFDGKRVVLIFCGSNIDWATFAGYAGFS